MLQSEFTQAPPTVKGPSQWPTQWQGLPYYPIGQYYKSVFGQKVYKIPVTTAETCPNREGLRGMKTCNFCDVWGSAAYPEYQKLDLREQILTARERIRRRVHADKFLVYFQAYTTTFEKVARLREQFAIAAEFEDVVGVVVGTRPDCISDSLFDLWNEYSHRFFVAVEFGVQTFNEEQLLWMRRGHTAQRSIDAIHRTAAATKVNLGLHLIFGNQGETISDVLNAARMCNDLPIQNVKLHNMHVLKNTPLADDFLAGQFVPITWLEYAERVKLFLQHLRPDIAVHRLSALASRSDELIAPAWTSKKMEVYQNLIDYLIAHKAFQGQFYQR
jgi:uncharacterized protein